ncbi:MAG: SpoIIIAH-like family protein [Paenibacillaceae bacterium]|nr:SpoIIIAH-like family protein [Paenibacillaceae bacterium]
MDMKKLFRRNQIIITTLAVMIAAAGYLNYAGKQDAASGTDVYEAGMTDISEEDILAENQALNGSDSSKDIASLDQDAADIDKLAAADSAGSADKTAAGSTQVAAGNETAQSLAAGETQAAAASLAEGETQAADTGLDNPGEAVLTSGMNVADYISSVQLNREQVRARNKETLMNLINNPNIEEAAKQQAIQQMVDMTAIAEKENAAETLLLAKGFADPVVSISNGKVDVVINAASISDPQRAQIEDIVKRKTEVGAESIVITLMKLEE